jgi:hypothetical protein
MSYVIAAPEMMTAAATDLAGIGSALTEAHTAAATPTIGLVPAAADEVSAGVAHLFSRYAEDYHALAGKAAAFQEQFVQHLHAGAFSYASIEAALASLLQDLKMTADVLVTSLGEFGRFLGILPGMFTSLPPPWALVFLLGLPVEIPVLYLLYLALHEWAGVFPGFAP